MYGEQEDLRPQRYSVLDVFGITLEVSNPKLAQLLTMDAADALTVDVRDIMSADRRAVAEALPDTLLSPSTPHAEERKRQRQEFRAKVDALGAEMDFSVEMDGTWCSPVGIDIVTRAVERPFTAAAAAHYVSEVATMTRRLPPTSAILFVVESDQTADAFKVAIRQSHRYDVMRTVSLTMLEEIRDHFAGGHLDHKGVLVLLAPIANIDVGEMMAVLRKDEEAAENQTDEMAVEGSDTGS